MRLLIVRLVISAVLIISSLMAREHGDKWTGVLLMTLAVALMFSDDVKNGVKNWLSRWSQRDRSWPMARIVHVVALLVGAAWFAFLAGVIVWMAWSIVEQEPGTIGGFVLGVCATAGFGGSIWMLVEVIRAVMKAGEPTES
jgi:hypothetical protein